MTPENWKQIDELFHRGLALSDQKREQLIASEPNDLAVQLRLLWQHAEPTQFMQGLVISPRPWQARTPQASDFPATESSDLQAPLPIYIGKYRILSLLGEGGMGSVFLAQQQTPIARQVAIKIIKRGMDSQEILSRFKAERQTLAVLDHPSVAHIYDADVTSDGRPFFIMEYVEGIPITEYCDRNVLDCKERLVLFQKVCSAVHHAHQRGVIHRDIKPSNVLVTLKEGLPIPKIIDFGVAKATNRGFHEKSLFTELGMLVGTPEYMSPEQAECSADVDTTSDVYSLGVLLYELLTGALPFDPKELRRLGLAAIQRAISEYDPPRPTTRLSLLGSLASENARCRRSDVSSLIRQLNGDLDWIVMKAIEKDRSRRYSSASEFAADIGRTLSDQPVVAGPVSVRYQLSKFARRHRIEVLTALSLLAVVLAGLVSSTVLYLRAESALALAAQQTYKASLAAALASVDDCRSLEARQTLLSIPRAIRQWEWNFLYSRTESSLAVLNSGEGGVHIHIGFGKDEMLYVSTDTSVHAWNLNSLRRTDYGPFPSIISMSPDGRFVISRTLDGDSKNWQIAEAKTRKVIWRVEGQEAPLVDAAFDAEARHLVTLTSDYQAKVWDLSNGNSTSSIRAIVRPQTRAQRRPYEMVALSPDGSMVARTEYSDIRLYEASSGRPMALLRGNHGPIQSISFSDDGRRLMSAGSTRTAIWNVVSGRLIWESAFQKAFSIAVQKPGGGPLAVAVWHHAVLFMSQESGQLLETALIPATDPLAALKWSPDGTFLVGVDFSGGVRIWNGQTLGGQNVDRFDETTDAIDYSRPESGFVGMSLGPDGRRIFEATAKEVRVVDASSGKRLLILKSGSVAPITAFAVDPMGKSIASGSGDKMITIQNINSSIPIRQLTGHADTVSAIAYSPDGKSLISGSKDRTLRSWNPSTGASLWVTALRGPISNIAISPDNRLVAVVFEAVPSRSPNSPIQLLDIHTGAILLWLQLNQGYDLAGRAQGVSFSPDGRWLAAVDVVAGPGLWDVRTGKLVRRLLSVDVQGYTSRSFTFSPDGRRLVGCIGGGHIPIWNPNTGELVFEISMDCGGVRFSPDGRRLYVNEMMSIEVMDSTPTYRAEVIELIQSLKDRFPLLCDMRSELQRRGNDRGVLDEALHLTDHQPESERNVKDLIDSVIDSQSSSTENQQHALRQSRIIAETYPWDQPAAVRLGAALYRNKEFGKALEWLERAEPHAPYSALRKQLFLAMDYKKLGNQKKYREHLDRARSAAKFMSLPLEEANFISNLLRESES